MSEPYNINGNDGKKAYSSWKELLIWVVEFIAVYLLPFFIFAIVFGLAEAGDNVNGLTEAGDNVNEKQEGMWKRLILLPNWMLIGIILFGESLKELIEFMWDRKGNYEEGVKISISLGLFGISMCAVFLAVLITDEYVANNNLKLSESFYYWQLSLFIGAAIYSVVMRLLIANAKSKSSSDQQSSSEDNTSTASRTDLPDSSE